MIRNASSNSTDQKATATKKKVKGTLGSRVFGIRKIVWLFKNEEKKKRKMKKIERENDPILMSQCRLNITDFSFILLLLLFA